MTDSDDSSPRRPVRKLAKTGARPTKTQRVLGVLLSLQSNEPQNVDTLAATWKVDPRLIFRDLADLRLMGFPIETDLKARRYRFVGSDLPFAKELTFDEAVAIAILCREVAKRRQLPFYDKARSGAEKLVASLSPEHRARLREIGAIVRIDLESVNPLERRKKVYDRLVQAILDRRTVRLRYQSFAEKREIVTSLSPYRLLFQRRSWYVVGRSSLHKEVRTFNVGRILKLRVLDRVARIPRSFRLSRYLRNAWRILPQDGPDATVVLKFRKMVAGNVAEVRWHPTQKVSWLEGGELLFVVRVSGLEEISWWILGYGPQVEVLEPPALRDLIAARVREMATIYDRPPTDGASGET